VLRRISSDAGAGDEVDGVRQDGRKPSSVGVGSGAVIDIHAIDSDDDDDDDDDDIEDEDEDEDGPVIVPFDEVEASIARSSPSQSNTLHAITRMDVDGPTTNRKKSPATDESERERHGDQYPLLFAAQTTVEDHSDILMTCARILDERTDVSLVREAAAYLEEVEARR